MLSSSDEAMRAYENFISSSRYSRWIQEKGRRETWGETCGRYLRYWVDCEKITTAEYNKYLPYIVNKKVMPSMRCMMTAGEALDRDNMAGFNCSYIVIDGPRAFDELMYVLMCGTGVGYSVEKRYTSQLPVIAEEFDDTDTVVSVRDSKIGWAKATREVISLLYAGRKPKWDTSKVRGAGERLKVFGGRASGPQPLIDLFQFLTHTFENASGRKLNTMECHDICCKIAEVIVVGGVRRSALISLSDPVDNRLRRAKSGQWWLDNPQRALANNSAVYDSRPDFDFFMNEMVALYESKSGERGIINREAAVNIAGRNGRRDTDHFFGNNPCSEILLRPNQTCNLTEIIVRDSDTLEDLLEKVEVATIFGTLQATLTNFRYLRKIWQRNTEEECLLGVSLTGIMDHPYLSHPNCKDWLEKMRDHAIKVNKKWAKRLGINQSTAITCVKPSGTVSQLCNTASGIHPRFSPYYIRTVRADKKDPLAQYMQDAGFPCEVDVMKDSNLVFSFPIKSPEGAVCVEEVGAIEQLELWKVYQNHWCEHKPSITVYYKDIEFFDVCSWIWKNWDICSGISLLPYSDHTYQQAPYQKIEEETFLELSKEIPQFEWDKAYAYEKEDQTSGVQTLACVGSSCEI